MLAVLHVTCCCCYCCYFCYCYHGQVPKLTGWDGACVLWSWQTLSCSAAAAIAARQLLFSLGFYIPWLCMCFMLVLAGGKAEALAGLGQGSLQPFHVDRFEPGHSATNFARWSTSNETYDVSYSMVS